MPLWFDACNVRLSRYGSAVLVRTIRSPDLANRNAWPMVRTGPAAAPLDSGERPLRRSSPVALLTYKSLP